MYGLAYKLTFLSEQVARISLRESSFSLLTDDPTKTDFYKASRGNTLYIC